MVCVCTHFLRNPRNFFFFFLEPRAGGLITAHRPSSLSLSPLPARALSTAQACRLDATQGCWQRPQNQGLPAASTTSAKEQRAVSGERCGYKRLVTIRRLICTNGLVYASVPVESVWATCMCGPEKPASDGPRRACLCAPVRQWTLSTKHALTSPYLEKPPSSFLLPACPHPNTTTPPPTALYIGCHGQPGGYQASGNKEGRHVVEQASSAHLNLNHCCCGGDLPCLMMSFVYFWNSFGLEGTERCYRSHCFIYVLKGEKLSLPAPSLFVDR